MTKLLTSKLLGSAPARSRRGRSIGRLNVARTACLIFAFCTAAAIASPAQTFDILFEFQGFDGSDPSDSPVQGFFETGLRMCPLEKRRDRSPLCRRAARSLKSGLPVNNREIRALFAYFGADRAKILCSSDCMAEEERFKLSVRFCRAKARRVRKLQIAKSYQRISHENSTSDFAISPVLIRHLFAPKRRMRGDSVAKMVTS